jgi:hypothetical protein
MSKNQQKSTFNEGSGLLNSLEPATQSSLNTMQGAETNASNAYAGLGPTGINNILQPASTAASGILGTGGYSQPQLNTLESQESSNLGGLDPGSLSQLSGQYQNLISSGGISDATTAAMQRQATSGVSNIYGVLGQNLARNKSVTGGEGGGGETAQMARQLSGAESNAVTGVNAEVGQLRQQGTEAGLSGASNLAASQAAAQNAAANTFSGTQSGVASGVQTGAGLVGNVAGQNLSGNLASAGGLTNLYGATQSPYESQLSGELGFLNNMSGIANNQQGAYGNLLAGAGALGSLAGGAGNLLKGIGSL